MEGRRTETIIGREEGKDEDEKSVEKLTCKEGRSEKEEGERGEAEEE